MTAGAVLPGRYVSVPTSVHAEQWTRPNRARVLRWLEESGATFEVEDMDLAVLTRVYNVNFRIGTPQGMRPVRPGDWVVRGVLGEWYPIANAVHEKRYRPAEGEPRKAGEELGLVREAAGARDAAEQLWREAIRRAYSAGASVPDLAREANVSKTVIRQLVL